MRRTFSAIVLVALLVGVLFCAVGVQFVRAGGTIYIRADGSVDPPTAPIQRDGDVYTFADDVYDSIVVQKNNSIVDGAGKTVQGTGEFDSIGIDLSNVVNVTVRNARITAFYYAVCLDSSSNDSISANNITGNNVGMWLHSSSNYNGISDNNITGNGEGIALRESSCNSISGNTFFNGGLAVWSSYGNVVVDNSVNGRPLVYLEGVSDCTVDDAGQVILVDCNNILVENLNLSYTNFGVQLWGTNNTRITENNVANNDQGIGLYYSSNYNSISGNNVTANYWEGVWVAYSSNDSISGNDITNNGDGVWLDSSSNNTISGNSITTNNADGVWVGYSSNDSISGNDIANNGNGVCLDSSSESNVGGNNVTANSGDGVHLYSSSDNSIGGNNITNNSVGVLLHSSSNYNSIGANNITGNGEGILLYSSSANSICHNDFIDNARQVYDYSWDNPGWSASINVWDDGYSSGGNFWSDYNGTDLYSGPYQNVTGSDGMGDTAYVIDVNNQDNFPLMNPWAPPDVAVLNVTASKTVVGRGCSLDIHVTVANLGNKVEAFNVMAYGNTSNVRIQVVQPPIPWRFSLSSYVMLPGNSTAEVAFTWNTSGFAKGVYRIKASAEELPSELNTTNNRMDDGTVFVTILGDVNGDGKVRIDDVLAVALAYGSNFGEPRYNANCDINDDLKIRIDDVLATAQHFGQGP